MAGVSVRLLAAGGGGGGAPLATTVAAADGATRFSSLHTAQLVAGGAYEVSLDAFHTAR